MTHVMKKNNQHHKESTTPVAASLLNLKQLYLVVHPLTDLGISTVLSSEDISASVFLPQRGGEPSPLPAIQLLALEPHGAQHNADLSHPAFHTKLNDY